MSLILDALNRSRGSTGDVPNLDSEHAVESISADVQQYIPWVIGVMVLVLLCWFLWRLVATDPAIPSDAGSPVAELTENIGSAATSITTELKARAEAREYHAETSTQPALVSVTDKSTKILEPVPTPKDRSLAVSEIAPVQEPVVALKPEPEPKPATADTAVARLYRERTVAQAPAPAAEVREEQPLDIEKVLERAQAEIGSAELDDHPVPYIATLSQQAKNEIPTLYYQKHDYASDTAQSRVTLNGKTLRVGGSPVPGVKVEEILRNSVVLDYRGTQFRLRSLNSWINL
ncbi:MAG: general secretion pathway protein GspB [Halioglobus sp.]|nr:general secretion pathway protein GspB [Halioglobus sp.]